MYLVLIKNYESYKYLLKCELNEFISRNELMRKILLSSFDDQTLNTKIKYLEEDSIERNCTFKLNKVYLRIVEAAILILKKLKSKNLRKRILCHKKT